jgi:putative ABC transport system substrate-binding protein
MRRREFIAGLGSAALWAERARAQQAGKLARVGILSLGAGPTPNFAGLQNGLRKLGYVEGQNLIMFYRWAAGRREQLTELASELLQLQAHLFVSNSTEAVAAVRAISDTVPIVMLGLSDPIGGRVVASLTRPGGSTTGVTLFSTELAGKRLELLREVVPRLESVAILAERDHSPSATLVEQTRAAAEALGVALKIIEARPEEITQAFRSIGNERADALIVQSSAAFTAYMRQIGDLAISYHLPTIHEQKALVENGGLMSYGPNFGALGERAADYVDRILKGTKPADLPVEQPTRFELVINMKTAKALGLTIPETLLATADQVIE